MNKNDLHAWCSVPREQLVAHPELRIPFRMTADSGSMGELMARELVDDIMAASRAGTPFRAIIPCGPSSWYEPFARIVNAEQVSLAGLVVFHMDECLDWQGKPVPRGHPYSFRGYMEQFFYDAIDPRLAVPVEQRYWLEPQTADDVRMALEAAPLDIAYGGWGQDGHVAYNQARRNSFSPLSISELRESDIRIQDNNVDTVVALGQRMLGSAFALVPPMSITLGMRQILSARKIRLFSDTGAWKQTALRVALFSPLDAEFPMTLLQEHPDALITATMETADHPISQHPEWDFGLAHA